MSACFPFHGLPAPLGFCFTVQGFTSAQQYEGDCGCGQEGSGASCPGWRDLSQTKWRLSKGDEQLDFTYHSAPVPHHISDEAMSELAVCIYKVAHTLPVTFHKLSVAEDPKGSMYCLCWQIKS